MPNDDPGLLITLNIALTCTGILAAMIGMWAILKQANANTTYLADSTRRVAEIAERIDSSCSVAKSLIQLRPAWAGARATG